MTNEIIIKTASSDDAQSLLGIYAYYVENTAITFEYEVPTLEEFKNRIINTLKKYPYITASINGETVGYAYTGAFKERAAYSHSVETSIYVKKGLSGKGIGKALYAELENISKKQNVLNMNACISYTENPDEYLSLNSPHFHEHLGYRTVGKFTECGYKFGKWYDMIWMEKMIGEHTDNPPPFIPFPDL